MSDAINTALDAATVLVDENRYLTEALTAASLKRQCFLADTGTVIDVDDCIDAVATEAGKSARLCADAGLYALATLCAQAESRLLRAILHRGDVARSAMGYWKQMKPRAVAEIDRVSDLQLTESSAL